MRCGQGRLREARRQGYWEQEQKIKIKKWRKNGNKNENDHSDASSEKLTDAIKAKSARP